ncbi:bilin biosynthesis protein [Entomortierella parvispora]|uniref:Bilin biosynthesis protein n=1 Tax=Entomortierella parvispora TaxID=205924 RepID=A0A9P3H4D1_9FUNG|nr:bilin biosynthesis protein [Entomortierella parvispora]
MPFSVQDALRRARAHIEAAREVGSSKQTVITHYRAAKSALCKVGDMETNLESLKEVIAAFQELAVVLDHSEEQERAVKCRQRAETMRKKLDGRMRLFAAAIAPSLIGPGFSQPIAQAGAAHWSSLASLSSTPSTVTTVSTSTATCINPVLAHRPLSPAISREATSCSASTTVTKSLLFFSNDVKPVLSICPLPCPGEPLQTTRQLAYCLALLQTPDQEENLPLEVLEYRQRILDNPDEKSRLESMSGQIIQAFKKDSMKDAAAVAEVVELAPVLNGDQSRFLFTTFIDTMNQSEILHLHSVEGLAKVIHEAAPGSIDSDDLVRILRSLHNKLQSTHSESNRNRCLLLSAVSRVLDAMGDAHVGDVDRVNLHEPLTDLLRESESSECPYLTFQAAYATQALLNVSDDENIWHAGFRRGWLVLKGGAGFSQMPNPTEIGDALEGLETLYEAGKGSYRMLKDTISAIRDHEKPTFTVKEGLKFRRAWYRALRTAEAYIHAGKLVLFKDLVTTTPCRHYLMFQWGVCKLLGRFASDARWDSETRQEAVVFLRALYKADGIWKRHKEVDQAIFDALTDIASDSEAARLLLEEMRQHDPALKPTADLDSPLWNSIRPANPTVHATPNIKLLKVVQDKSVRHAKLEHLPNLPVETSLADIHSALQSYHAPDLVILRVSGDELDLKTCFVNLAIVEAPFQRQKEKKDLKEQAAVSHRIFHRIASFEKIDNTDTQALIPLEQLFDKRELQGGKESYPRRILVQGRAGIGKTTLCKRLVHAHQNGLWRDQFDIVLWLPLRQLRGTRSRTLEALFQEKVFMGQDLNQEQAALARALAVCTQEGRVLFILDGLDEIVTDAGSDENKSFRSFLRTLLHQQHVVITSRPSGLDRKILPPIDLELETVGFSQQNVDDFLIKVLEPDAARTVQDFIRQTPLIQGLVNIPVQLDVICFSWDSLPTEHVAITMTGLYQLMVRQLWRKDAIRLKKTAGGQNLTERQINKLKAKAIDALMATELQHLGYLAFKGMTNSHQIEFDEDALLLAFEDLEDQTSDNQRLLAPQLVEIMKQTSFLHTADADLDSGKSESQQAWHFLHLTFQEYFAATWIVRHFQLKQPCSTAGMMTKEQMTAFVHQHKYNPQYEIVWTMVAGLLEDKPLSDFFGILQGAPRDLIGGRHQQMLASCLNEARDRLDPAVAVVLEAEFKFWLRFEMCSGRHAVLYRLRHAASAPQKSVLGCHPSFPDTILIETLNSKSAWRSPLALTLADRPTFSDSAIQFLITGLKGHLGDLRICSAIALAKQTMLPETAVRSIAAALKDKNKDIRDKAALILHKQAKLSDSAVQSLLESLKDEDERIRSSLALALHSQADLSESAVLSHITSLSDEDEGVRSSAASALDKEIKFSESAILSLIATLSHDNWTVRFSAASILDKQSALPESAIQALMTVLEYENEGAKSSAAWILEKQPTLPETTIHSLVIAFKKEDVGLRSSAISILSRQSNLTEFAIQSLTVALKEDDKCTRSLAVLALGRQCRLPEPVIQSLVDALKDDDEDIRSSAALALGKQSALPESVILSLITSLKDNDWIVRSSATTALDKQSMLPESAIQSLIITLQDEDDDIRSSAASLLRKQPMLSESAILSVIGALKDSSWRVTTLVKSILDRPSILPESAIWSLIASLNDEEEGVVSFSVYLLRKQCALPESAILSLITALRHTSWKVRASAESILVNQSKLPEKALQSLIAALKHKEEGVRSTAARAINRQCPLPESAIQSLITVLKDGNLSGPLAASILDNQSSLPESAIQSLITTLKDKDGGVRSSAAMIIGKQSTLPGSAIQSLVAILKDNDHGIRSLAASIFDRQTILPESTIQPLVAALSDKETGVRSLAASALSKQSTLPGFAMHPLIAALEDEDEGVRSSSALALGSWATLPESAIQTLIITLHDNSRIVRSTSALTLGKQSGVSESVTQSLIAALEDEDEGVMFLATSALSNWTSLSESALQSLVVTLGDNNGRVRFSAAWILYKQSMMPGSVIQSLIAAPKDNNWRVRLASIAILGKQSGVSESAIHLLIAALKDEVDDIRTCAASVLSKQSTLPESAIQSLIATLDDDNWIVGVLAGSVLDKQSPLPESAIQSLITILKDEVKGVKSLAASVLGKQSALPESAILYLTDRLKDGNWIVRSWAVSVMEKQSSLPELAIHALVGAFEDKNENVRSSAVLALNKQSVLPESVFKPLVAALNDKDEDIRAPAMLVLRQYSLSGSVIQSIVGALMDENEVIRSSAIAVLGTQSRLPDAAIQPIIAVLSDESLRVRRMAVMALRMVPTLPESTLQLLVTALKDDSNNITTEAAEALSRQSVLPTEVIKSLVSALKGHENVKALVTVILQKQHHSLFTSLPHLTKDEIACLYEHYLFPYSCSHVISLQVQDGKLCFYTEQGVLDVDLVDSDREEIIASAFKAVQHKAELLIQ